MTQPERDGLPISDEAIKAVARAVHALREWCDWPENNEVYIAQCEWIGRNAIDAFLKAERFSQQRRELYSGSEKIGKGSRLVSPWRPA